MPTDTLTHSGIIWTNITHPTPVDIEQLGKTYPQFHPLDLEDCLSHIERPKIDEYDNYMFIVMQFPFWDREHRVSRPAEVDFFIGKGFLVTVHEDQLKPLTNLYELCRGNEGDRERFMTSAGRTLYTAIDRLVDYIFPILYKVDANIRKIEAELFSEDMQETIQNISFVRRDIVALRRIIRPQVGIVANLGQVDRPFIHENLDVYFDDILDHLQKARDIVDDDGEVIANLADTSDALASHRINEVMRILTVFSVIMLPLTLISGILGMNIPLPLPDNIVVFWGVMGAMLIISLTMLVYFRHRNWL